MASQLQMEESLLRPMRETVHEVRLERRSHAQPTKSTISNKEHQTTEYSNRAVHEEYDLTGKNYETVHVRAELLEEIDVEETEYNVVEVVQKQNTHDLVCPHCSSCITRSVIVRPKRPKPDDSRDPEAFRCGSCFTLFIRIGTSIFSRTKTEEMETSQEITTSETTSIVNSVKDTSSIVIREYDAVASTTEVTHSRSVTVTDGQTETLIDHSKEKIVEAAVEPPHLVINNSIHPLNGLKSGERKIDFSKKPDYTNGNVTAEDSFSVDIAPPDVDHRTEEKQSVHVQEPSNDFDVLKSIVYGGLIESITSLGVVSSAVGAGTSTLNIFVLALANLIGGLFILAHNLKELKKETDETTTQTDTEDNRYSTLLGRRGRFLIHATVVVISYIIFGLVAPITYGFSFYVSNDRDYKLASVAAASLFCILSLSLAKAHVKNSPRPYIKTVLEYLSIGFAASGISFLAGELLDKIMEKLGWLGSTCSVSASLMTGELGWTS